jgi:hypothetical protein
MEEPKEEEFKEYFHLNEYYLKVTLFPKNIKLISFNTERLGNIMYQCQINQDEIMQNKNYNNKNLKQLFQQITNSLDNNKYVIQSQNNGIMLSLYEGENFILNKDLQFILIKADPSKKTDYEKVMENIIKSLRRDLEELKLEKTHSAGGQEYLSYPGKLEKIEEKDTDLAKTSVPINKGYPLKNEEKETAKRVENDPNLKKIITSQKQFESKKSIELNISALSKINYGSYPSVELSSGSSDVIAGYGGNSYNGRIRKSNEDKIKIIPIYKLTKEVKNKNGDIINPKISYFAIYDGHGGNKCSIFLQENLHEFILTSDYFPLNTIQAIKSAYIEAEKKFLSQVYDPETKKLSDKSGSCAVSALFIDEWCFITNLGDSRGLYSFDTGNKLYQITRDHKPNDPIERERVEKAGGKVYKDEFVNIKGEKRRIEEKDLAPGMFLPYRIIPGNIAVSNIIINNNFIIGIKKHRRF